MRVDIVQRKTERALAWLDQTEAIFSHPPGEPLDPRIEDAAILYLFLSIQECIDLAAHWVAEAGWGAADDAASTFDVLADRGAIERDLAEKMRNAVGLRNRIAHGYATVDQSRVKAEYPGGVAALRKFLVLTASAAGL